MEFDVTDGPIRSLIQVPDAALKQISQRLAYVNVFFLTDYISRFFECLLSDAAFHRFARNADLDYVRRGI